ncbi:MULTISPECIES: hypothetical protein [Comamonas]|jgi:hypothetical protein|uniref:hypothetical protein n=1 Tax=Comamonas TaxID=283 RepID=UPI0011104335|nr:MULTISPECIES: hypothetical protein [Comamonas]QQN68287.1 hypothetical protein IYN88_16035 [Comamonas testosteroni]
MNRSLTVAEMSLARWMLENGVPEAKAFLGQLESLQVTPWRCVCGCASIDFQLDGHNPAPPGVHILGDFLFNDQDQLAGAFIYESGGLLSGIEVCGFEGDAPRVLPVAAMLRPLD